MPGGYKEIYEYLVPKLEGRDLAEAAVRLGMEVDADGNVRVRLLGRDYTINYGGVEAPDGKDVHVNNKSVLIYYMLSPGSGQPGGDYVPLHTLTGIIEGQNALGSIMNGPLTREFGNDYAAFARAAKVVGGKPGEDSGGKHEWYFDLLPKIPGKIVFYEADEEFPAEVQIYLDGNARQFLEFECLAFLTGCLVNALVQNARGGDAGDWAG